ncbi:hypothetical protein T492DRAFT_849258 [Pavlovales sp. CCMP2436]|nr:hypothetical protein T492DRAFT_849258 [Pavlovales sp. CCMP2436]
MEFELEFTRGLYPAYPPWLRLLSPRLKGTVGEAVMASSMFTPTGWDSLLPCKAAVRHAQAMLECSPGVTSDLLSTASSLSPMETHQAAGSAPTRVQHVCSRLEALSCATYRPRWAYEDAGDELYR